MKTNLFKFSTLIVIASILLSACGGGIATTDLPAGPYVYFSPDILRQDPFMVACAQELVYTGWSEDDRLLHCGVSYTQEWLETTAGELQQTLGVTMIFALPAQYAPQIGLPSAEMLGPVLMQAGILAGATVAYAYTLTPAYAAKMQNLAVPLPSDKRVLVPAQVIAYLATLQQVESEIAKKVAEFQAGNIAAITHNDEVTDPDAGVVGWVITDTFERCILHFQLWQWKSKKPFLQFNQQKEEKCSFDWIKSQLQDVYNNLVALGFSASVAGTLIQKVTESIKFKFGW